MANLIIDPEFKSLIPPLSPDELAQLEANISEAGGATDALKVWHTDDDVDVLLDGHNRLEICTRLNLPYTTRQEHIENRSHAIEWILRNQLGRRNLSDHMRVVLALQLEPAIAARAKERQVRKPADSVCQISDKQNSIDTKRELAAIAGVSHDTVQKVKKIESSGNNDIIQASRAGEISINKAYQTVKAAANEIEHEGARENQHSMFVSVAEKEHEAQCVEAFAEECEETEEQELEYIPEPAKHALPHVAHNTGNNEWYTPPEILEAARQVLGAIDLDPASCAIANQNVQAKAFFSAEDDGLAHEWNGKVWMNPPYSAELCKLFCAKMKREFEEGRVKECIILVNNATDTEWFRTLKSFSSVIGFTNGRVKFLMSNGTSGAPLQGQAILYAGEHSDRFIECFSSIAWFAYIHREQ